jgi:hypothetical protein
MKDLAHVGGSNRDLFCDIFWHFSWRDCERLEEISGTPVPPRIPEHESDVFLVFYSASCFMVACLVYSSTLKMEEMLLRYLD